MGGIDPRGADRGTHAAVVRRRGERAGARPAAADRARENGPVPPLGVPGDATAAAPEGTAFALPADARLRLRIHYKKSWQDERAAQSDRSAIGLYFANPPAPGHDLQTMVVDGDGRDV